MATFVLFIICELGGCVDICTSHANSGGSVTRSRRVQACLAMVAVIGDWGTGMYRFEL